MVLFFIPKGRLFKETSNYVFKSVMTPSHEFKSKFNIMKILSLKTTTVVLSLRGLCLEGMQAHINSTSSGKQMTPFLLCVARSFMVIVSYSHHITPKPYMDELRVAWSAEGSHS